MRKFKLRNNAIVEELDVEKQLCDSGGYPSWFKVVEHGDMSSKVFDVGEEICLVLTLGGFPVGGMHGKDFDVVEEI